MAYLVPQTPPDQDQNRSCPRCFLKVRFRSLQDLFYRPYWTRRWIIQEIAVASQVRILCGDISLSLRDFVLAVTQCLKSKYWQSDVEAPKYYFDQIMYFRETYSTQNSKLSLAEAVILGKSYQSIDPRDKIYALLGLMGDTINSFLRPNYEDTLANVYANATRHFII